MSAKDRLLAIILAEKANEAAAAVSGKVTLKASSIAATAAANTSYEDQVSCGSTDTTNSGQQHGNLLRRGFAGLRRSFRRAAKKTNLMKKTNVADFSHDSGLGEDSDTSHRTTPIYTASPTIPTPILRTTRSFSNDASRDGLKHVMIREPSLRHLPSALRNSFPGAQPSKPILVRLETAKTRHYRYSYHADNLMGDVSPQWGSLYFRAAQEVKGCLQNVDNDSRRSLICDLIFSTNARATEDKLMVMEAEEVDETINLLYKILYHDWLASEPTSPQLSIILHCVQKFLIVVVNVCPELEASDRQRLSICGRGLLRQCEDAKYSPIAECLSRTRTFYIQVWTSLLCVPFAVSNC